MTEVRVAAFEGLLRGSLKSGDHEGCDGLELVTKNTAPLVGGGWRRRRAEFLPETALGTF